jgi:putative hydrolase of the HAD superfamily
MFSTILFDLDETLYPRSAGLMDAIGARITDYIEVRLGVSPERARELRRHFRGTYGTALRGLMEEGHPVDLDDYLDFVHKIPLDSIGPEPALAARLNRLPLRRAVLTNSNIEHARRILDHMHLTACFEQIIDIRALNYVNKPDPRSYTQALEMMGAVAAQTIFVEDNTHNTRPAREMGITTIVIDTPLDDGADYAVATLNEALTLVERLVTASGQAQPR